ncbi:hypothetical protein BHE74_00001813 [Ensete ventricosum]|nr:hypothetical protein GW17_00007111 [Ensete ventricosum]RWW89253.1 hypothetical protein BHE74_00001813 [Ensete ventricosum]
MNLHGMKRAFVTRDPRPEPSQPLTNSVAEASATHEADPLAKKMKVLVSKEAPCKDALLAIAQRKETSP